MKITEAAYAENPYPYYADLRARGGFVHDDSGLVLATDSRAARAVLAEASAVVRPPAEPVPAAVAGSAAGEVFGRLIRMTETPERDAMRRAMVEVLTATSPADFRDSAYRRTRQAIEVAGSCDPMALAFSIPVETMADQLGYAAEDCASVRHLISRFVGCISPLSGPDAIAASIVAASALLEDTAELLAGPGMGLARRIEIALRRDNAVDDRLLAANLIGMMSQTFDATAALVGQALVALARHRGPWDDRADDPALLDRVLRETLRHDAPIQSTRRFMAADAEMDDGTLLRRGQPVLVLLASANRDEASYADPDRFDIDRQNLSSFSFSFGRHRCPGEEFARAMAAGVITAMRACGLEPSAHIAPAPAYSVSFNARLPILAPVQLTGR